MIFQLTTDSLASTTTRSRNWGSSFKPLLLLPILLLINSAYAQIAPNKLSGSFGDFQDVTEFQISPDGAWVVFIADKNIDNNFELYSVPIDGGSTPRLNRPLVAGGKVRSFKISPDSLRVVYLADQDTVNQVELYSVPIADGSSVKLNTTPVLNGDVLDFDISADSTKVVYRANQDVENVVEVFTANIEGGGSAKLNGPLTGNQGVGAVRISSDSAYIVYRVSGSAPALYSAPIASGGATFLVDTNSPTGNFEISKNTNIVVFRDSKSPNPPLSRIFELFSIPIVGGTPIKLNEPLPSGGRVLSFQITPDGQNVVYWADQISTSVFELFVTPVDSQNSVRINGGLTAGGDVNSDYAISPDSRYVVYLADQEQFDKEELYSLRLGSGLQPSKLSSGAGKAVLSSISRDSTRVVFGEQAFSGPEFSSYLRSRRINGGAIALMDSTGSRQKSFVQSSDDAKTIVYAANGNRSLRVSKKGGPLGVDINSRQNLNNSLIDLQYAPGGQHLVYLSDDVVDEKFELFAISAPFAEDAEELCFPVATGDSFAILCL